MSKITDALISYLLKNGVVNEMRNVKMELDIPNLDSKLRIEIEHITTRVVKKEEETK